MARNSAQRFRANANADALSVPFETIPRVKGCWQGQRKQNSGATSSHPSPLAQRATMPNER